MDPRNRYLGDGVYVTDLGHQIQLWTERPGGAHEIYLGDSEFIELCRFVAASRGLQVNFFRAEETADGRRP